MKKIYRFLFAGVLALCATGCSSSLLDIENPNEVTNTTFWKSADDAKAGVNACYSFLYKEGTWMRWLSFRYDLSSDEGWSSSPWIELGDWTRFLYNNYDFYEGNKVHWEHFYVGIFRCNRCSCLCDCCRCDFECIGGFGCSLRCKSFCGRLRRRDSSGSCSLCKAWPYSNIKRAFPFISF